MGRGSCAAGNLFPCNRSHKVWTRSLQSPGRCMCNSIAMPTSPDCTEQNCQYPGGALKQSPEGLGANVTERSVIQSAKSLKGIIDVADHFDQISGVTSSSIQHTLKSNSKDQAMILEQLTTKSQVFGYIPGCQHCSKSFANITPNQSRC